MTYEFDPDKYVVIKQSDIDDYLRPELQDSLIDVVHAIDANRLSDGKELNSYIVCNKDEDFADEVWATIQRGMEENDDKG